MDEQQAQVQEEQQAAAAAEQVESNDAFAAGFSKARGEEPAPTAEVKTEAAPKEPDPPKAEEAPAQAAAPDEWAGVPPKVKAELESITANLRHLSEDRLRPFEGRWKQMQQVVNEWQAAKSAGTAAGAQPSAGQKAAAATSSEKWERLKEDFPEWAEAMEERLASMQAAPAYTPPDLDKVRSEIRQELEQSFDTRVAQASRAAHGAVVEMAHAKWQDTIRSPEFKAWRASQSAEVNALGASESAADAIKMLDLFKESRKKAMSAAARLKAAQPVKGVAVTPAAEDEDAAFSAGFNRARGGG